jgi:hypothetical protein
MKDDNLLGALISLRDKEGDAYDRLVNGRYGGLEAYEANLNAALRAAKAKGFANLEEFEGGNVPTSLKNSGRATVTEEDGVVHVKVEPLPASRPPASSHTAEQRYIPPQLAYDGRKLLNGDPSPLAFLREGVRADWVMEPKFDGWRWQVHLEAAPSQFGTEVVPTVRVRSIGGRNGKDHSGEVPEVDQALVNLIPPGSVLDGELMWENSLVGSRKLKKATFIVFDVLRWEGNDVMNRSWEDRRSILENVLLPSGLDEDGGVVLNPAAPVDDDLFDKWIEMGLEGAVFKRRAAPYLPGSRRKDGFIKMKPHSDTHATIIGYEMGKGQSNRDRVGNLEIVLHETDQTTSVIWDSTPEEAQALIGKTIEVQHFGFQPSGKVRHPSNPRLRPDLEPVS